MGKLSPAAVGAALPAALALLSAMMPGQAGAQFGVRVAHLKVTSERRAPRLTGSEPMLAGVMSGDLARPIARARIYVFGLRPTDRTLCVRVQSMDGAYEVTMEAGLQGGKTSPDGAQIDFARDVRYPQIAVGRPGAEFAIRAQAVGEKGNCNVDGDLLVASWQPARPTNIAMPFLSGSGSAALFLAPGQRQNCPGIAEVGLVSGQRTSFDRVCQVPVLACGASVSYPIRRVNSSGAKLGTINARFRSPC